MGRVQASERQSCRFPRDFGTERPRVSGGTGRRSQIRRFCGRCATGWPAGLGSRSPS
jgi:hypothetical protein